ncbi:MAG: ExeM/NucH family extracellular endonuclease [Pseudomonadota bacterium]
MNNRISARLTAVFALLGLAACGGGGGGVTSTPAPPAPPPPPPPPTSSTPIGEVQGTGSASPLVGQTVAVEGVVVGDFQEGDADTGSNLGGFYIVGFPDASLDSSDGIFIFDGDTPSTDVSVGDSVSVTGEVSEFFGETQITASTVAVIGGGSISPATLAGIGDTVLNSDGDPIPDLERFEGMLVRFTSTLTVSDTFNLGRFGELVMTLNGRGITFTNNNAPSVSGFADFRTETGRRSIILDDGQRDSDVRPVRYFDDASPIRTGDTVTNLTGVLRYSRGAGGAGTETWRLMPTEDPVFVRSNPRTPAPNPGGSLRVASFNVLNLFTTIDNGSATCGPSALSCRGADSSSEFDRQLDKIVAALAAIDADIVGFVEIENNASESLDALVTALAAAGLDYDFVDTGTIGTDAIKVGFIYKPATVQTVGGFAILDSSVDARFIDSRNRPVLAQTFSQVSNGAVLTVATNHLKSKGSDCDDLGDPDLNDGQGNCNVTRRNAASAMVDWLATDPTSSGDSDVLIIGDLNAYYREDPATIITAAGYTNLVESANGSESYSFVFRGNAGALDHAFANASLAAQVTGAVDWHINADEWRLSDYNEESNRDAAWFDGSEPFRSSDHDPLIVGLELTP